MTYQQDSKAFLKVLSQTLGRIHKRLMDHQMHQRELRTGQTLSPAAKLNLLLQDPEFAWLRVLSQLMVLVDDVFFQKEPITDELLVNVKNEVQDIMLRKANEEFTQRFELIAETDQDLRSEYEKLKLICKGSYQIH